MIGNSGEHDPVTSGSTIELEMMARRRGVSLRRQPKGRAKPFAYTSPLVQRPWLMWGIDTSSTCAGDLNSSHLPSSRMPITLPGRNTVLQGQTGKAHDGAIWVLEWLTLRRAWARHLFFLIILLLVRSEFDAKLEQCFLSWVILTCSELELEYVYV